MSEAYLDRPKAVREGEGLDWDRIGAYLRDRIPGLTGDVEVQQFPSGFSNLTYLIRVGDTELVLRRPPFGTKAATAHDMSREFRILTALRPVFPYVPEPLVYCEDAAVSDAPFYVMERLRGVIPRSGFPKGLDLGAARAEALCENMVALWARLHALDIEATGLAEFGKPEGYVERQVTGWSGRYRKARTPDAPDFEGVMAWLAERRPASSQAACMIHNDFKFDNLVLDPADPTRIVGVLDWELSTVGDPLMDLGSSLAYWVEEGDSDELKMMRQLPTHLPGMFTRARMLERYAALTGRSVASFEFYLVFGWFRLAVIAQQIYYRFYHGQTKDPRFQMLVFAVGILDKTASALIEKVG